jgi:hypothetical protein
MDDAIMDPQLVQKLLNLTKEEIDTIVQGCPHVALRLLDTDTTSAIYVCTLFPLESTYLGFFEAPLYNINIY